MHLFRRKSSSTVSTRVPQPRIIIRTLRTRSQTPEKSERNCVLSESEYNTHTPDCLKAHNITPTYRARMVDWMVEITSVFQLSTKTLFLAVKTMDKYFTLQTVCIHSSLLHIIGMVCVFISSKLEDVEAISMGLLHNKIGHGKFSVQDICVTEQAVLKKLGFLVNFATRCDFIEEICEELGVGEEIKELALFFARVSAYFYTQLVYKESQVAFGALYVAGKVKKSEDLVSRVLKKAAEKKVYLSFEGFYSEIAEFPSVFPSLKSVFKASKLSIELNQGEIELKALN